MSSKYLLSSVPENKSVSFVQQKRNGHTTYTTNCDTREELKSKLQQVFPDEIDSASQLLDEYQGRENELLQYLSRIHYATNSDGRKGGQDDSFREDHEVEWRGNSGDSSYTRQRQEDMDHMPESTLSNPQGGNLESPVGLNLLTETNNNVVEDENDYIPTDYKIPDVIVKKTARSRVLDPSSPDKYEAASPSGKKTVAALVRLRAWDTAAPRRPHQFSFLTSTHLMLPSERDHDHEGPSTVQRGKNADDERKSYSGNEEVGQAEITAMGLRPRLCVGTIVGIQLKTATMPSSFSQSKLNDSSISVNSSHSYSGKRSYEWRVGNSFNIHEVNILSLSQLAELHYQIENDYSSLRELVMDGWPLDTVRREEVELILEALGPNTSIKRLSMRYSNVTDDVASHCALALVKNESLTQLSLEGNNLSNLSVQNFYAVLKKNNATLRLLDLSHNAMIDDDVEQSLDQYMEQRAVKRTLTNKAEKAKRKARGLPPDPALDDSDDDGECQVTVVMIDEVIKRADGINGAKNSSGEQRQLDQSDRDREAFFSFTDAKHIPQATIPEDQSSYSSHGSSITSRSFNRPGTETDIVTTTPHDQLNKTATEVFDDRACVRPRNTPPNHAVIKNTLQLKEQQRTAETQSNADAIEIKLRNPPEGMNVLKKQISAKDAVKPALKSSSETKDVSPSDNINPSLELSDNDYIDDKADERELRRRLGTEVGAVGAYHINEVAFARQNRAGRSRMRRTESQRRARLAELTREENTAATDVGASDVNNDPIELEPIMDADIERADDTQDHVKSGLWVIGLDGVTDKIICGTVALLLVALLAMVITITLR